MSLMKNLLYLVEHGSDAEKYKAAALVIRRSAQIRQFRSEDERLNWVTSKIVDYSNKCNLDKLRLGKLVR